VDSESQTPATTESKTTPSAGNHILEPEITTATTTPIEFFGSGSTFSLSGSLEWILDALIVALVILN